MNIRLHPVVLRAVSLLTFLAAFVIVFAAGLALADVTAPVVDLDNAKPWKLGSEAYDAIVNGKGWLAVAPIVTLVVFLLKKYDALIPKVGPAIHNFMEKPLVSFALPFVVSGIGGFATAMGSGMPVLEALGTAGKVALAAITMYIGLKKGAEQMKPAVDAGKAAATDPGTGKTLNS